MRPIAIFMLVAALWDVPLVAQAAVTTAKGTDNDRVIQGVAGPTPPNNHSTARDRHPPGQPSKPALKKAKVKQKPGLNDPN